MEQMRRSWSLEDNLSIKTGGCTTNSNSAMIGNLRTTISFHKEVKGSRRKIGTIIAYIIRKATIMSSLNLLLSFLNQEGACLTCCGVLQIQTVLDRLDPLTPVD